MPESAPGVRSTLGHEPELVDLGADQDQPGESRVQGRADETGHDPLAMARSGRDDRVVFLLGESGVRAVARGVDGGVRRQAGRYQRGVPRRVGQGVSKRRRAFAQGGVGESDHCKEVEFWYLLLLSVGSISTFCKRFSIFFHFLLHEVQFENERIYDLQIQIVLFFFSIFVLERR